MSKKRRLRPGVDAAPKERKAQSYHCSRSKSIAVDRPWSLGEAYRMIASLADEGEMACAEVVEVFG